MKRRDYTHVRLVDGKTYRIVGEVKIGKEFGGNVFYVRMKEDLYEFDAVLPKEHVIFFARYS